MTEAEDDKMCPPRVHPSDLRLAIAAEHYFTAHEAIEGASAAHGGEYQQVRHTDDECESRMRLLTFCVLTLRNGFVVTGHSACVSKDTYNVEDGRKYAREAAVSQLWPLLGFRLQDKLHMQANYAAGR